jgi:hypothetical protein
MESKVMRGSLDRSIGSFGHHVGILLINNCL